MDDSDFDELVQITGEKTQEYIDEEGGVVADLTGKTIEAIRPMTGEEMEAEGWTDSPAHERPPALVLEDGTVLYPSTDPEGNGRGALFGDTGAEKIRVLPNGSDS